MVTQSVIGKKVEGNGSVGGRLSERGPEKNRVRRVIEVLVENGGTHACIPQITLVWYEVSCVSLHFSKFYLTFVILFTRSHLYPDIKLHVL